MTEIPPKPLPSARESATADGEKEHSSAEPVDGKQGRPSHRGRGRRGKRGGKRRAPPPARSIGRESTSQGDEAGRDAQHVDVEVDGHAWRTTVKGRGLAGRSVTPASLVLLGFTAVERPDEPDREAWVLGDRLDAFTVEELLRAFGESRPAPASEDRSTD